MLCPKCRSKVGLYKYRLFTQSYKAQGITCPLCGYWVEIPHHQTRKRGKAVAREKAQK